VVYLKILIAIVLRDLNGPAFSPALVEVTFPPERMIPRRGCSKVPGRCTLISAGSRFYPEIRHIHSAPSQPPHLSSRLVVLLALA
jgi:hypothetical protein